MNTYHMLSTSFCPDVDFCEFVEVLGPLFLGEGVGCNGAASELDGFGAYVAPSTLGLLLH